MSDGLQALSEREKETLRLLLGGHDIKSIAAGLGLSVHTVNERLREARRKLGASSSRQAARILAEAEQPGPNFSADPHFSADKQFGVVGPTARGASHQPSYRNPGRAQSMAWLGGGMLIMSLLIALAVLSAVNQGDGKTPPPAPTRIAVAPGASESADSARDWLALVDGQHWDDSWSAAGAMIRSNVPQAQFVSKVQPVRQPLGAVTSRVLQSVIKATALPGVPDGQYEILQFATSFTQKAQAIETVTLAREGSAWKVDGYFIK